MHVHQYFNQKQTVGGEENKVPTYFCFLPSSVYVHQYVNKKQTVGGEENLPDIQVTVRYTF